MILNEETKSSVNRFIDRCLKLENYMVCFYLEDGETSDYVHNYVYEHFKSIGKEDKIKERCVGISVQTHFKNGSSIQIFNRDLMVSHIRTNVAIIDNRLRENYIRESVYPILCEYRISETDAMINPKPIYIKFLEEENNDQ